MANPRNLRTGLGNQLKTIAGLGVYERWPNQINPPCAVIGLGEAEPEQTLGRGDLTRWNFDLYLFQSLAGGYENAQDRMDVLLATSSTGGVYGAIAADRTLGGRAHSTFIKGFRDYDQININEQLAYMGAIVDAEIWAS